MHLPAITATYLAVLALLFAALGLRVIQLRRRNRTGFGDGDNAELRAAIRCHANFAEYVPVIVLMVGVLEASGAPHATIHLLMAALLLARLLHPIGMHAAPGTLPFNLGRVAGMAITVTVLIASALLILSRISLTLF